MAAGSPPDTSGSELTLAELGISYLDFAQEYYANDGVTTSEYNCIINALKPLHQLYSRTFISRFGPLALKAVRQHMIDQGWSRPYINRQVNRIRRILRWGTEK